MIRFEGAMHTIVDIARKKQKRVVLPESEDIRVLKAASIAAQENIASIILIGEENKILDTCKKNNIVLNENIKIVSILDDENYEKYVNSFYELRKHKGVTLEKSKEILKNNLYYATMMLKENDVDGMVCGAIHSTSDSLRPALQIIKKKENIDIVSAFFLMETKKKELGSNGLFIFADCGLIEFPSEYDLCDIVKSSVESFKELVPFDSPRVAMLSYSTKGSAQNEHVEKVRNVADRLKKENLDFEIDGELQLDAAIIPEVAKLKAPDSKVAGNANILIFPDLQAGNIGYKLVQRFSDALAFGPITQGLKKPVNDLSRGCSVEEIVGTIAITCLQSK